MTWNEAIELVLREKGEPMHYVAITEEILRRELRDSFGASPTYTVNAQLTMDIQLGERAKFARVATGIYGMRDWLESSTISPPSTEPEEPLSELKHLAIQAFGMYWDREKVDWTKSTPKLFGQQFQNANRVDLGDQRGLYLLYDHRSVVYVGRATQQSLASRLRDHTADRLRSRWNRFSWFGFWGVSETGALLPAWDASVGLDELIGQFEAMMIEVCEPPLNRQQGKGLVANEFLQSEDPALAKKKKAELLAAVASKLAIDDE